MLYSRRFLRRIKDYLFSSFRHHKIPNILTSKLCVISLFPSVDVGVLSYDYFIASLQKIQCFSGWFIPVISSRSTTLMITWQCDITASRLAIVPEVTKRAASLPKRVAHLQEIFIFEGTDHLIVLISSSSILLQSTTPVNWGIVTHFCCSRLIVGSSPYTSSPTCKLPYSFIPENEGNDQPQLPSWLSSFPHKEWSLYPIGDQRMQLHSRRTLCTCPFPFWLKMRDWNETQWTEAKLKQIGNCTRTWTLSISSMKENAKRRNYFFRSHSLSKRLSSDRQSNDSTK